jgi:hypothetical protein
VVLIGVRKRGTPGRGGAAARIGGVTPALCHIISGTDSGSREDDVGYGHGGVEEAMSEYGAYGGGGEK